VNSELNSSTWSSLSYLKTMLLESLSNYYGPSVSPFCSWHSSSGSTLTFCISSFCISRLGRESHIWLTKLISKNLAGSQIIFKAYVSFEDTNKIHFPELLFWKFWKRFPTM
jgi:hypothetical protein